MTNQCCNTPNETNNTNHPHNHEQVLETKSEIFKMFIPAFFSFILLLVGLLLDHYFNPSWFTTWFRFIWYVIAYIPVGVPVIKEAYISSLNKDFFSEFFLMSLATIGAFAIGEFPEGVAVMLFYTVGDRKSVV